MSKKDLLVGAGLGATLAFMFDPQGGGRRRALVRDKMVRASRKTRDGLDATARDMANRTKGLAASARGRLAEGPVEDARLAERVRAQLGRATTHPGAIDVHASDGNVTLFGPILTNEVDDVLALAASVRGVHSVTNALEPHDSPDGIPALQGDGRRAEGFELSPRRWSPTARALAAAAGLAATGVCVAAYARQ